MTLHFHEVYTVMEEFWIVGCCLACPGGYLTVFPKKAADGPDEFYCAKQELRLTGFNLQLPEWCPYLSGEGKA